MSYKYSTGRRNSNVMRLFFFILCCVLSVASDGDNEGEIESQRKKLLDQLTRTRTVLREGYDLVTRQIAPDVVMFRSYRSVSAIFYPISRDVKDACFTFQSEEIHLNNIGSCSPQEVVIHIKRGAYAAVNPDGYDFPKYFIDPVRREKIHTIEIKSDGKNTTYCIKNPKPGNWYALVYIKWEDPRTQNIGQQGLIPNCNTILYTDLQVKREENVELVDCYTGVTVDYRVLPALFKCMSVDKTDPISFNITVTNTLESNKVLFMVQALSFPTDEDYLISCAFDPKLNHIQTVTFSPSPSAWHYIYIEQIVSNASSYADCELYLRTDDDYLNQTTTNLMRDDKGTFFAFDYGLPTTDVHDVTSVINVTSDQIKTFRFTINKLIDIGGSVSIAASLLMSLNYYMGYKRELKKGALLAFTEENQFIKVVICLDIGHSSIPTESGHCKYNDQVKPALFVLNSTDSESIDDKVIIPFPESGTWYLTLRLFCDEVVCPCKTSHNGTKYYVDTEANEKDGEDISGELSGNLTRLGESKCNGSVLLALSSTSCIGGRCSNHGNCLVNTLGGLMMSFCSCSAGYGAWDCSDESRMDSRAAMLLSVLLLTLSNLLFFFAIYVAIIRQYYTEAMMYAFTMLFSTFYHACEAPAQIGFCLMRLRLLQFGDFYCGIMCFWVTLIAMCIIHDKLRSFLQLSGAIVVAMLTTWNMHSFVAFLTPCAVAISVLLISWYYDYRKTRKFLYPRSYYMIYMPIGLGFAAVGLILFGFFQTEKNYYIVHSFWHMVIAVSAAFLLPDIKRDGMYHAFAPSRNMCSLRFCNFFRRSRPSPVDDDS